METQPDFIIKKDREHMISIILITLTTIFWGLSFISTKLLLNEYHPSSIAIFRQFIALVPLTIAMILTKSFKRIYLLDLGYIAFAGFFGIVLYFVFENSGMQYTTASNASIIVAAVPIFTLISEILFFKMKPSKKVLIGIFFSIAGVYMVISVNGKLDFSSDTFFGNMLIIGAMISWVIYTIINKLMDRAHPPIFLVFYQTLTSAILFIPFVAGEVHTWHAPSVVSLMNLIYLGVFCSAISYIFFVYAAKRLGPAVSSTFLNLIPVVSVSAGYLLLGECLNYLQIIGMFTIIASLYVITRKTVKV